MPEPTTKRAWYLPSRRWLRFSLRGLLLFMLLLSLPLGWLGMKLANKREERKLVEQIEATEGTVNYASDYKSGHETWRPAADWLGELLGQEHLFDHVEYINWHPGMQPFDTKDVLSRLIKQAPYLKEIVVSGIDLGDAEMEDFKRLTQLKHLELVGAPITDKGIASLAHLPELNELRLDFTDLSDDGLNALTGLRERSELHFTGTQVTRAGLERFNQTRPDIFPDSSSPLDDDARIAARELIRRKWDLTFGSHGELGVALLDSRALTGQELAWLSQLPSFKAYLSMFDGEDKRVFASLVELKNFCRASIAGLDDKAIDELPVPSSLKELLLWGDTLGVDGLGKLAQFPLLESLRFEPAPTSALELELVARVKGLRRLSLNGGNIVERDLAPLAALEQLAELEFSAINFDEHATAPLSSMMRLKKLTFSSCDIGDDDLTPLFQSSSLEQLSLFDEKITNAGLLRLAELKSLKELRCLRAKGVTPEAIEQFRKLRPDVEFTGPE